MAVNILPPNLFVMEPIVSYLSGSLRGETGVLKSFGINLKTLKPKGDSNGKEKTKQDAETIKS